MSLSSPLPFRLDTVRFHSGVRRSFLVDGTGLPEWYSSLYVTMSLRNAGLSVASQQAVLNAVNVLFAHATNQGIDLVGRFEEGKFLDHIECEALRRSVQVNHGPDSKKQANVVALGGGKRGHIYSVPPVASTTQYKRLSYMARYLEWLGRHLAGESGDGRTAAIAAMRDNILALRPDANDREDDLDENSFTHKDDALLRQIATPGSTRNPFVASMQVRNALLIELMRLLGKRRGEVLNIRVRDVNLAKRQVSIVRRSDDKDDSRVDQPRAKTRTHTVAMGPNLVALVDQYLVERRAVSGATKQPYLFVTHKSGPTQGQAMTIEALKQVFKTIKKAEPRLSHLHPHLLRHFNQNELARTQGEEEPSPAASERHRRERNHLSGRAPESDVDAVYTRRETERRAKVHSLRTQEALAAAAGAALKTSEKERK